MQTLKQVKIEMYNNMKDRWNDFLEDEEKYIVEFLKSDPNLSWSQSIYNEAEAFNIACESLEWDNKTDKEELNWEAWYARWYELALKELASYYEDCIQYEAQFRAKQVFEKIQYLLNN